MKEIKTELEKLKTQNKTIDELIELVKKAEPNNYSFEGLYCRTCELKNKIRTQAFELVINSIKPDMKELLTIMSDMEEIAFRVVGEQVFVNLQRKKQEHSKDE